MLCSMLVILQNLSCLLISRYEREAKLFNDFDQEMYNPLFFYKNQKLSLKIAIKNFFLWQKNWKDMRGYFQTNSKCNYSIFCGYVCKKLHQKNQKEKPFLKAWPIKNAYNSCYLTKLSNLCKYIPVESLAAYVMNND